MSNFLTVLSSLISLYMLVIVFRILLTWFPGQNYGRGELILRKATDPYLNFFRRARFMRVGYVDFSPLVAIATLSIVSSVLTQIAFAGSVTVGFILSLIVLQIGYTIRFVFLLLSIVMAVRAVAVMAGARGDTRFWMTLDHMLQPLTYKLVSRVVPNREVTYKQGLWIGVGLGVAMVVLVTVIVALLVQLLSSLPV